MVVCGSNSILSSLNGKVQLLFKALRLHILSFLLTWQDKWETCRTEMMNDSLNKQAKIMTYLDVLTCRAHEDSN